MPRKTNDLCMFCTPEELCEIHKPKEKPVKKAPRKKASSQKPTSQPSQPAQAVEPVLASTSDPADLKAAMKAAAAKATPADSQETPMSDTASASHLEAMRQASTDVSMDTGETEHAINNLESILHPDEKAKYAHILNRPDMRAERWKARNRGSSTT